MKLSLALFAVLGLLPMAQAQTASRPTSSRRCISAIVGNTCSIAAICAYAPSAMCRAPPAVTGSNSPPTTAGLSHRRAEASSNALVDPATPYPQPK